MSETDKELGTVTSAGLRWISVDNANKMGFATRNIIGIVRDGKMVSKATIEIEDVRQNIIWTTRQVDAIKGDSIILLYDHNASYADRS